MNSERVDGAELQQIAARAADITQLLITVTPESRGAYVERLRPLAATGMPEIAKSEIVDRIPDSDQQTGAVRAVGVREVTDDHADVTVVIDETGPGALARDDGAPSQLILSLLLKHSDGQWKLAAVAAATI